MPVKGGGGGGAAYTDAQARAAAVSDAVYGAGWDGVIDVAPSKNAVYDKIETLGGVTNLRSTYATRPAAGTAGRIWLQSDGPFMAFDDGVAWKEYFGTFPLTTPINADFAWVNQGGASVDTTYGGILLIDPTATGNSDWRIRKEAAPATPYHIEALISPMAEISQNYPEVCVCFRESATGKLIVFKFSQDGIFVTTCNSPTADAANVFTSIFYTVPYIFLRLGADGTNLTFDYSYTGVPGSWLQLYTQAKAAFFTTAPDEVGFAANARNATYPVRIHLLSWKAAP